MVLNDISDWRKVIPGGSGLLARQILASSRVKHVVVDSLDCHYSGNSQDVMRAGSPRYIGRWAVESQQNLAVGIGPRDVTHEPDGNVSGIQVREDSHVGRAIDLTSRVFPGGDLRNQRGIHLQFSIEVRHQA